MSAYTKNITVGQVNIEKLHEELSGVPGFTGLGLTKNVLDVYLDIVPNVQTENDIENIVSVHDYTQLTPLQQARASATQERDVAKIQLSINDISKLSFIQVDNWVDANVVDLASAKDAIKKLAHAVVALSRLA